MLSLKLRRFVKVLYDDWYPRYSEIAHLAWAGMVIGVVAQDKEKHAHPGKLESDALAMGVLCLVMILSEVETAADCGYATKLRYLWTILGEYCLEAKDYYDLRYRELLSANEHA